MPVKLIFCASLPPATRKSVPIYDFAIANQELAAKDMETYYPCCGKSICKGCVHSSRQSGNYKCPFCNSDRGGKTDEEDVVEIMKRVEATDAASIYLLGNQYHIGRVGLQQDLAKAIELYARAADLGYSQAHYCLGNVYEEGGNLKKAKFHFEAAAMAGDEVAQFRVGNVEMKYGNTERAVKHWTIAASAGCYHAMHTLNTFGFKNGLVSRESIDSTLAAYNHSCAEMRSNARDACINAISEIK
jgi:TPR repeat protein